MKNTWQAKPHKYRLLPKDMIIKALKDYRSGKRSQHGMGQVMKSEVLKNTDAEIEALAEYITSLKK